MRRLSKEIDSLKRKYDDTSRAMLRNRTENENLIKNMKTNIENLKCMSFLSANSLAQLYSLARTCSTDPYYVTELFNAPQWRRHDW